MNNKKTYVCNAFSLQMLDVLDELSIHVAKISEKEFKKAAHSKETISAIGHKDTASVLGLEFNRMNLKLEPGDHLYVAQLSGGRLPEGATSLPEGFKFDYYLITVY